MLGFASFLSLDIQEEMLNVTVKVRVLSLYYYFYTITHINWWILWNSEPLSFAENICNSFLPFYSLNGSQNVMSCCVYVYMVLLFDA